MYNERDLAMEKKISMKWVYPRKASPSLLFPNEWKCIQHQSEPKNISYNNPH